MACARGREGAGCTYAIGGFKKAATTRCVFLLAVKHYSD